MNSKSVANSYKNTRLLHERILGVFDEKWKQINYRRKSDHVQVKMNLQLSDGYVKHANLKDALYKCNQIH